MASIDSEAVQVMVETINSIIPQAIDNAKYDRHLEGEITSVEVDGRYGVLIYEKDKIYKIYPPHESFTFVVHDRVWVVVPCNNFSKIFISGRRNA